VVKGVCTRNLFPEVPTIYFYPQGISGCEKLTVFKSREKKVVTLDIGAFKAKEIILQCPEDKALYSCEALKSLTPYRCTFGYDVIVYVGYALFVQCRSEQEIVKDLAERNISISDREISFLGKKFVTYLALAHRESQQRIRKAMAFRGGYILHLDGTCEGDSPHLFSGLDGISELVLDNVKLPSEKADLLIPFLRQIRQQYGEPVALVHDMGKGIITAIGEVFPGKPDFICHFHFLRDIGKDLLQDAYQRIRTRLRKLKIRTLLRQRAKALEKAIGVEEKAVQALKAGINKGEIEVSSFHRMPDLAAFTMIHWAFDTSGELKGYGFPFDHPHLLFCQRLKMIYSVIEQIRDTPLRYENKTYKPLFQLFRLIKKIMDDQTLSKAVAQMQERPQVCKDLRQALRIALPEGKRGLNDDGEDADIKTIEEKVKKFRQQIATESHFSEKQHYKKMIQQIDAYWEKLFADPIPVDRPNGRAFIQPQRTNNTLERFFRDLKRRNRKKSGTVSLTKTLKTILSDTPLVKNLDHDEYLSIILDGCSTLEERFEKIDSKIVVEELKKAKKKSERLHPELKKMIKQPEFPNKIRLLFAA
jgi:hypothetical protein